MIKENLITGVEIMTVIKVSHDRHRYTSKPTGSDIASISNRIAGQAHSINRDNIKSFAQQVGENGQL